jgi:hypothetical protein
MDMDGFMDEWTDGGGKVDIMNDELGLCIFARSKRAWNAMRSYGRPYIPLDIFEEIYKSLKVLDASLDST